jgi:hypothetical protein
MKPVMPKHPLADDTVHILKNGGRVRVYGKENDRYLVISIKDGKQWFAKYNDFSLPSNLQF